MALTEVFGYSPHMSVSKWIEKLIGSPQSKDLKRISKIVAEINSKAEALNSQLQKEEDFPTIMQIFRERHEQGESLESLLPEVFATVKLACKFLEGKSWMVRGQEYTWDMPNPYDVQLLGGVVIHEGKIAEMRTGEGKTLVSTFPVILNTLSGKGVFLVTVNDYLAERDAEWMSGVYKLLGLSVGIIKHGKSKEEKKAAYACDVIYGTNNEFGFDYLRDNMAQNKEDQVQRHLNYAIIDEVDSILIDEARTPLIISAPAEESTEKYLRYFAWVQELEENVHYNVDEKQKTAALTEEGISKMEKLMGLENIYVESGFEEVHHIEQALRAHAVYKKDIDYLVSNDKVMIVDEFTGRIMEGRRYGQGLHQALEAKEGLTVQRESKTLATITFQNYFRMFQKLAGMTGTAITEEEEFAEVYGLNVVEIPTHKSLAREDKSDAIYKNTKGKFEAIAKKTQELHAKGQPVLIGTISVEKSEALSKLLKEKGISHAVLNAKQHEKEAEIVSDAGKKNAVTIATNMAGRGTDIKLGLGVKELGGLYVIGSERHESRRIDNQLRGRSGRQGDPGTSQFYVSMEDDLMRIFGGSRMQDMMNRLGLPEDMPIENKMISRSLEGAQKKVEGRNFDIRKHLVKYDDVMNTHRNIMYSKRQSVLENENLKNEFLLLIESEAEKLIKLHPLNEADSLREIHETVSAIHKDAYAPLAKESLHNLDAENMAKTISEYLRAEYFEKEKSLPDPEILRKAERFIMLRVIDTHWMRHVSELKDLREAVSLSGYGQRDPLIEYQNLAYVRFEEMMTAIDRNILQSIFRVKINFQLPSKLPSLKSANPNQNANNVNQNEKPLSLRIEANAPCPCGSERKFKKCHGLA